MSNDAHNPMPLLVREGNSFLYVVTGFYSAGTLRAMIVKVALEFKARLFLLANLARAVSKLHSTLDSTPQYPP